MREVHKIPGGIPAQELVDRVMEVYTQRRIMHEMPARFWAIREEIVYWGTVPIGYEGGTPGRHQPTAEGVLVWDKDRVSLHSHGNVVAVLKMNTMSDLVLAVSIDGDTGYTSVRDLLTVLRQLDTPPPTEVLNLGPDATPEDVEAVRREHANPTPTREEDAGEPSTDLDDLPF